MSSRKRGTVDWKRISLIVLCVVLSLILVALIFATTYVNYLLGLVGDIDPTEDQTLPSDQFTSDTQETIDPTYTGPVEDPTDVTVNTIPSIDLDDYDRDGIVNVLLVGQDRREGEPRQRSDSMILCTFNTNKGTFSMTSFLRDTYVYIPGYGNNKMNAAYVWGGFSLLNETLMVNFGVHVDANIEVDFNGFIGIIDLLGGVDIELTAKEAAYMNKHKGFEYNKDETWNLVEGVNHLNADQALAYARIRKLDSDFIRTQRQRTVLMALLNEYKSKDLATMIGLMDDILPLIKTNMSQQEIMGYVVNLFPMLINADLSTQHIPAYGTYEIKTFKGIGECLVPDLDENRDILAEILYN